MILEILNELASTLKIKEKEAILKRNADNELLKEIFRITYTKQIMFYIKKFPTEFDVYRSIPHSLEWAVNEIMENLATRKMTGHDARDHLRKVASLIVPDDREVLRRIINRDLECGAGTTLPNRIWKNLIPEQPQCLATAFSEKAVKRIPFPAISQLKADGARSMSDLVETEIRKVSRAGNEYQGLTDIDKSLRILRDNLDGDYVIDGEFIYINGQVERKIIIPDATPRLQVKDLSFLLDDEPEQEIIHAELPVDTVSPEDSAEAEAKREEGNGIVNKSLKGTISDEEQKNIVYQVWDLIPYDEYYIDKVSKAGYKERFEKLRKLLEDTGVKNIQLIPSIIVNNIDEAKADYNKYRNEGKEGSILKAMNFLWKDSRIADQVKLKNKQPIDLKIIDVYPHTKDPNKIGGFVVEDSSGMARTNTGSGLTDTDYRYQNDENDIPQRVYIPLEERGELDRELIMSKKDEYIGAIVEMEVDGLQTSRTRKKGEPEYSFFLPIIKKIRWDKTQANSIKDIFPELFNK